MTSAAVIGGTGLVGFQILTQLVAHPSITAVQTITRRSLPSPPADPSSKLTPTVVSDSSTWPSTITSQPHSLFFSALGTTRADAGGLDKQRAIDYTLNLDCARAAKESGTKTYVLISSAGANSSSSLPYPKMKGQLEDEVKKLGFDRTVILQPGLLVGGREKTRMIEQPLHYVANIFGKVHSALKDTWAQDAETVARAAIRAGIEEEVWGGRASVQDAGEGRKVWVMGQKEIVELGKIQL